MQDMTSADTEDEIGNGTEVEHVAEEVAFEGPSFDAETGTPTTLDLELIKASPTIKDNMENIVALQTLQRLQSYNVLHVIFYCWWGSSLERGNVQARGSLRRKAALKCLKSAELNVAGGSSTWKN